MPTLFLPFFHPMVKQEVYKEILKQYWGYDTFRGIQEDIIESIGQGKDTLGLMPTGGGKSITFQVPTLAMEGLCLVITPLIALMKDQVQNLQDRGIKALAIHAGMNRQDILNTLENCIYGNYKFLYVSPERLDTDIFRQKLQRMKVCLITVDESHCISQWGYDFRPAYLKIANIRELLPGVPVLALTATATPEVVKDIQKRLLFSKENVFQMSFERKNLAYVVRRTNQKAQELLHILHRINGSGIIYVRNRKRTKEVAEWLNQEHISADFYHAGLDDAAKDIRQQRWQKGESRIMVATNAFGMGIDKSDVRIVIHIDLPDSIEAYFQEAGRAGRDGEKSYAVILYTPVDKRTLKKRISDNFPEKDFIREVYENLQYYFAMAMGDGLGCVKEFNLDDFCQKFNYFPIQVDSALKILTLAGYLEYTEERDNASRLLFTLQRDELYRLHGLDETTEKLIYTVLRSYTGLFVDYAFINEDLLASCSGLSRRQVYETLLRLAQLHILSYIPRKKTPYIIYTRERVDVKFIQLSPAVYEDRKKRFEERIQAMLEYVEAENICRSRMLLRYLGEKNPHNCGQCDACIQLKKDPTHTASSMKSLQQRLLHILNNGPISIHQLSDALQEDCEWLAQAVELLIDKDKIQLKDGLLQIKEG